MKFWTYKKDALKAKHVWQKLRFTAGKGYWLFGKKPKPKGPITMYDSVDVSQIPATAAAVAGYVGGKWPTFYTLERRFPKAHKLSIAVFASEDAECLDVEPGDARIDQAPAWVKRQMKRGVYKPVVYTSVSQAPKLMAALTAAGVRRSQYRLWTAHYSYKPHRCSSSCGFGMWGTADATQYSNRALGRNLDVSTCAPTFFDGPAV